MKRLEERIAFVKSVTGWSNAELARQAGTTRTSVTDWLKGEVGALSSPVAQRLSDKTPFTANWLATGKGDMYKDAATPEQAQHSWPFSAISERKVHGLSDSQLLKVETALLAFAQAQRIDIAVDGE